MLRLSLLAAACAAFAAPPPVAAQVDLPLRADSVRVRTGPVFDSVREAAARALPPSDTRYAVAFSPRGGWVVGAGGPRGRGVEDLVRPTRLVGGDLGVVGELVASVGAPRQLAFGYEGTAVVVERDGSVRRRNLTGVPVRSHVREIDRDARAGGQVDERALGDYAGPAVGRAERWPACAAEYARLDSLLSTAARYDPHVALSPTACGWLLVSRDGVWGSGGDGGPAAAAAREALARGERPAVAVTPDGQSFVVVTDSRIVLGPGLPDSFADEIRSAQHDRLAVAGRGSLEPVGTVHAIAFDPERFAVTGTGADRRVTGYALVGDGPGGYRAKGVAPELCEAARRVTAGTGALNCVDPDVPPPPPVETPLEPEPRPGPYVLDRTRPVLVVLVHGKTDDPREVEEQYVGDLRRHPYYYWSRPFMTGLLGGEPYSYPGARPLTANAWLNRAYGRGGWVETAAPIYTPGPVAQGRTPSLMATFVTRDGSQSLRRQTEDVIAEVHATLHSPALAGVDPEVVFVAHSMGGLVTRYLLSYAHDGTDAERRLRDMAASLRERTRYAVTLATPHDGTPAADNASAVGDRIREAARDLEGVASGTDLAAPFRNAVRSAKGEALRLLDADLPATQDLRWGTLLDLNGGVMHPSRAARPDGTLIPIYALGGRAAGPAAFRYTTVVGTTGPAVLSASALVERYVLGGDEDERFVEDALMLMISDFAVSSTGSGWPSVPGRPACEEGERFITGMDRVRRIYLAPDGRVDPKRPGWSRVRAAPESLPMFYSWGEQDCQIDNDGLVDIGSALGLHLGRLIISPTSDADGWYFDHTRTYDVGGRRVAGSWYRLREGPWDWDHHARIHRTADTGRWLFQNLLGRPGSVGPYAGTGQWSTWKRR